MKCGSGLVPGATFCTNCGNHAAITGVPARAASQFQEPPQVGTYAQTGYQQPGPFYLPPKTKTPAVLLAVFLGGWCWLYTYRADVSKFWIATGVGAFIFLVNFGLPGVGILNLGFWIWAIVDTANKPDGWYATYWQRYPRI